jgi:CTP synthase (UTP-ammonia lyase)
MFMPEISKTHMGGTMRLGLRPTIFTEDSENWSKARKLYAGKGKIWERHRHRYEVNPAFVERLEKGAIGAGSGGKGLKFVGKDEKGERMQILELEGSFCICYFFDPRFSNAVTCACTGPSIVEMIILLPTFEQTIPTSSPCKPTQSSAPVHLTLLRLSSGLLPQLAAKPN